MKLPRVQRGELLGLVVTLVAAAIYSFSAQQNTGGLMIIAIVVATFMGGLRIGLISATISLGFFLWINSANWVTLEREDIRRIRGIVILYYALPLLLGNLLERLKRRESELLALNNELEDRVAARAAELRRVEARLQSVIQHAPIILFALDRFGAITLLEGRGLAILDIEPAQWLGRSIFEAEGPVSPVLEEIKKALAGEEVHKPLAFDRFIFDAYLAPLRDANGELDGMVGVGTDVTLLVHASEELQRSNAELERFAYVASHDLQEPIRTMLGFVSVLRARHLKQLDEQGRTYLELIERGAARLKMLIDDLLVYSRLNGAVASMQAVPLNIPLHEALERLRAALQEAGVEVSAPLLPTVRGDGAQLTQVFQNLISNALKFRREGVIPKVTITAEQLERATWKISVSDNGIGIDSAYQEKIFEMFQRLHSRERFEGTGLGLSICRKIIERHGGKLWVESQAGEGSTFYFTLPALEELALQDPALKEPE